VQGANRRNCHCFQVHSGNSIGYRGRSVATLVFLYISASTLIFGPEVNSVLRETAASREGETAADDFG